MAIAGNTVFGIECDNPGCTQDGTTDVSVVDVNTGETAKELFVCSGCEDDIDVPAGYCKVVA